MNVDKILIDHADIITTHRCNKKCEGCIDRFRGSSNEEISIANIANFLKILRLHTDKKIEVLLLGGEPTTLPLEKLIYISKTIKNAGFLPIMSTNGLLKEKIIKLIPHFESIQITVDSDADIDYWRQYNDKINVKLAGDASLTLESFNHFIEYTKDFTRRSVSMYFTPDFQELCTDKGLWELLDGLFWSRNGSYQYTTYRDVRIKRCVPGETNIVDEPSVPKLYPNGNYNQTWCNEDHDPYLGTTERNKIQKSILANFDILQNRVSGLDKNLQLNSSDLNGPLDLKIDIDGIIDIAETLRQEVIEYNKLI